MASGMAAPVAAPTLIGVPTQKMKKLHWQPVDASSVADTVWASVSQAQSGVDLDLAEFESAFALKAAKALPKPAAAEEKPKFIQLIDPRRSQNIEIALSQFYMSHDEIVQAIWQLNTAKLTSDLIKRLIALAPTPDEIAVLQQFRGDTAALGTAEKFFMALNSVSHLGARLAAFDTYLTLDDKGTYIDSHLSLVERATAQVRESQHLQSVLTVVLALGNYMNSGARGGPATGFKLHTLTTLSGTKSHDNKTTLLHYLVRHMERVDPAAREWITELASVREAARIETRFMVAEVAAVKGSVSAVAAAVKLVQAAAAAQSTGRHPHANPSNDRFLLVMQPFLEQARARSASLDARLKSTQSRCEKLARFLGEPDLAWEQLFHIFAAFMDQYVQAEAEVKREQQIADTRKKNKELQAKLKGVAANAAERERRNSTEKL